MSDRNSAERALEQLQAMLARAEALAAPAGTPGPISPGAPRHPGSAADQLALLTERFATTEPAIVERARELADVIQDESMSEHDRTVARGQLRAMSRIPAVTPTAYPDVAEVARRLDAHVFGLPTPKLLLARSARLAVLAARQGIEAPAPMLLLVGPPGTGKTRLGQGVAHALDLPFQSVALAGQSALELGGQHPVWEGSGMGALASTTVRAGARRFVLLLDEVDKLAVSNHHGSAQSVLLGLLDDRRVLHDAYLDVDIDMSQVLVVATANDLEAVPAALRDRFEVIHVEAYTPDEIATMVQDWIFPELARTYGITSATVDRAAAELVAATAGGARDAKRLCTALLSEATTGWDRRRRKVRVTEAMARRALATTTQPAPLAPPAPAVAPTLPPSPRTGTGARTRTRAGAGAGAATPLAPGGSGPGAGRRRGSSRRRVVDTTYL